MGNEGTRNWSEWDRNGRKLEMALTHSGSGIRVTINLQGNTIAYLDAKTASHTLKITDLFVEEARHIHLYKMNPKDRTIPVGRNCGYGKLLMRALTDFARKNAFVEVTGVIMNTHVAATPYLLDWFARRFFTVERGSPADSTRLGIAARIRRTL